MIQFNYAAEMASICHAKAEYYVIEKIKCLSCFFHRFMAVFEGSNSAVTRIILCILCI